MNEQMNERIWGGKEEQEEEEQEEEEGTGKNGKDIIKINCSSAFTKLYLITNF